MKTIKVLFALVCAFIMVQSVHAQSGKASVNDRTKTATVKVYGECGMCQKRIEKAALSITGVQRANWNADHKVLTVKHDVSKKGTLDQVEQKIAAVGHDTEKYKAEDAAYTGLPGCCHYQRKQ